MSLIVDGAIRKEFRTLNRRDFVGLGTMTVAAACATPSTMAASGSADSVKPAKSPVPGKPMPIALSAITTEGARTASSIANLKTFAEFINLATSIGFDGIHMRGSLAGLQTPFGELYEMAAQLKKAGLRVSSVVPDFDVPINNAHAADCLRNITPYLAFAEIFGSDMIRVGMKSEADIPWAQRAADEAAERKLRLTHHDEARTMFETFPIALKTLKAINRPNFGMIYDEAQWIANTPDYQESRIVPQIKEIGPWIWEVFVKNNPGYSAQIPGKPLTSPPETQLTAPGGVNYDKVFEGLYAIGYTGWLTTHCKRDAYGNSEDLAARKGFEFLNHYAARVRTA
jgi:sugar phosphate isomerase/epimerase